jgi:hypothetical protein
LALLAHRSAPSTNATKSPALKLFGRDIRTKLPDLRKLISTRPRLQEELPTKLHPERCYLQKKMHDSKAKDLPPLPTGATVRIYNGKMSPTKAQVVATSSSPRSYIVKTEEGTQLRRNRRDLLFTKEEFEPLSEEEDEPHITQPSHENQPNLSYNLRPRVDIQPPARYGYD